MTKIGVLLADDHAVLRAGLRLLIDAQPDMEVVAEAADGLEAVRKTVEAGPDIALVDLTMPHLPGLEVVGHLASAAPRTRTIVLTMHHDPAYARAALAAGASGHLVKSIEGADLVSAIRAVHRGRTVVYVPDLAGELSLGVDEARRGRGGPAGASLGLLSPRERQVLSLIARGHTAKEIAALLAISVKTAETHRARLARKLGLSRRADLVAFALTAGLLDTPGPA